MKKGIHLLAIFAFTATLLAGCMGSRTPTQDPTVLLAQYDKALAFYNQIEIGMSYEAALALTDVPGVEGGAEPTEAAGSEPTSSETTIKVPRMPGYSWTFGERTQSVSYFFSANTHSDPTGAKFFTWTASDIAYRKDALSTRAQFEQVQEGMTYDEVAAIMGAPGRLTIANHTVRLDKMVTTTSAKGFPVMSVTTKAQDWRVYYWWADPRDMGADSFTITFIDDAVTAKTEY
jgi:hypothetical protein